MWWIKLLVLVFCVLSVFLSQTPRTNLVTMGFFCSVTLERRREEERLLEPKCYVVESSRTIRPISHPFGNLEISEFGRWEHPKSLSTIQNHSLEIVSHIPYLLRRSNTKCNVWFNSTCWLPPPVHPHWDFVIFFSFSGLFPTPHLILLFEISEMLTNWSKVEKQQQETRSLKFKAEPSCEH